RELHGRNDCDEYGIRETPSPHAGGRRGRIDSSPVFHGSFSKMPFLASRPPAICPDQFRRVSYRYDRVTRRSGKLWRALVGGPQSAAPRLSHKSYSSGVLDARRPFLNPRYERWRWIT